MLTVSHIQEAIKDQGSRLGMLIWPLFLIPPTGRGVANLTSTLFPKALPRCCFFQRAAANFNCFSYQHHHHHLHPSSTSHIHHLHHLHHLHVTIIFTTTCTHHLHHQHDSHHLDHLHGLFILQDFTHHLCDLHHFNHPLMYRHVGYQLLWTPRALEMTYNVLYIYNCHIHIYIYTFYVLFKHHLRRCRYAGDQLLWAPSGLIRNTGIVFFLIYIIYAEDM